MPIALAPGPLWLTLSVALLVAAAASIRLSLPFRDWQFSIGAVTGATIVSHNPLQIPAISWAAGAAFLALAAFPFITRSLRETDDGPVLHLVLIVAAAYGVIGSWFSNETWFLAARVPLEDRAHSALELSLWLAGAAAVGILVARSFSPGQRVVRRWLTGTVDPRRSRVLAIWSFSAYAILRALSVYVPIGQLPTFAHWAYIVGVLGTWIAFRDGQVATRFMLPVVGIVVVDILVGVGTGLIAAGLAVVLALLYMYVHRMRRLPVAALLAAVVLALGMNVAKNEFRGSYGLEDAGVSTDLLARGGAFAQAGLMSAGRLSDPDVLSRSAARFSYTMGGVHAHVRHSVPQTYSHWGATTYSFLPFTVVPRVLFPWKPEATFGNTFGRQYGLLGQGDFGTSANLPMATEGYLSFGLPGFVLSSLVFGAFLGLANRVARGMFPGAIILGSLLFGILMGGIESDATHAIGLLPAIPVVALPVIRFILVPARSAASR